MTKLRLIKNIINNYNSSYPIYLIKMPISDLRSSSISTYRQDIQGLRALSILSVFLFHIDKNLLPGGFIGVDLFFVISGYIVTSVIIKAKERNNFFIRDFYINRVKRIVPSYITMLSITAFVMAILLTPTDFQFFKDSIKYALLFNTNYYFANFGNYFAPKAYELPLLHTWSLAIEMQFYLFFPIIFCLFSIKYIKRFLTVMFFIFLFIYFMQIPNSKNYFSFFLRIPEFILGVLTLLFHRTRNDVDNSKYFSWVGIVLIILSFFLMSEQTPSPSLISIIPCLGCALIICNSQNILNHFLSHPILVTIGTLSYSLYLWHWPVLAASKYYNQQYELTIFSIVMLGPLIFAIAWLSYYFIETPFQHKNPKESALNLSKIIFFIAPILFLLVSPYINETIIAPLPIELTRYAAQDEICHGKIIRECYRGNIKSKNEFLVLGDSHAAQLTNFFDIIGKNNNFKAKVISGSSCIPIPNFDVARLPSWAQAACSSQIKITKHYTKNAKKIILVGLWQYHMQSEAFIKALNHYLTQADKTQKSIVILAQIPTFNSDILRSYRFQQLGLYSSFIKDNNWIIANQIMQEITSHHPSTIFLNLTQKQFFNYIPFNKEGALIYFDSNHLNELGSSQYGIEASKILSETLAKDFPKLS